jgi:hypothetical protein
VLAFFVANSKLNDGNAFSVVYTLPFAIPSAAHTELKLIAALSATKLSILTTISPILMEQLK